MLITHVVLSHVCDYQDINISFFNNQDYCRCRHSVTALLSVRQRTHQSFTLIQRGGEWIEEQVFKNRFLRREQYLRHTTPERECVWNLILDDALPDGWLFAQTYKIQMVPFPFCIRDLGLRSLFYYLKWRNCQIRSYTKGVKLQVVVKTELCLSRQYFLLFSSKVWAHTSSFYTTHP